jgi:hypothetical protein
MEIFIVAGRQRGDGWRDVAGSFAGSGRMTTRSATSTITSAGIPTRRACLRIASGPLPQRAAFLRDHVAADPADVIREVAVGKLLRPRCDLLDLLG